MAAQGTAQGSALLWEQLRQLSGFTSHITITAEHEGIIWNSPEAAQRFRDYGSPTGSPRTRRAPAKAVSASTAAAPAATRAVIAPDRRTIRAWAQAKGLTVSARGRVPEEIVAQFMAANH